MLALLPAFTTSVVIPWGPDFTWDGTGLPLIVANADTGVLLFLALASLGVYSLVMAGYASNNKFSLLGSIRASAQLISYELAMTVSVLAVVIPVGSFHLGDVVDYQRTHLWNCPPAAPRLPGLPGRRVRRDEPAAVRPARGRVGADRRLPHRVQRHALRRLLHGASTLSMAALSALGVTLYLGGWSLPWVDFQAMGWLGVAPRPGRADGQGGGLHVRLRLGALDVPALPL